MASTLEKDIESTPSSERVAADADPNKSPEPSEHDEAGDAEANGGAIEKTATQSSKAPGGVFHPDSYPEGGRKAWLTVAGSFAIMFVTFGWINGTPATYCC